MVGHAMKKNNQSILFLGRDNDGNEIWIGKDQITRHMFIAGSTGSGKTELLLNIVANSLAWGSGSLIVDGKGDISFFSKLHAIATELNREDDLLLLNFGMGNTKAEEGLVSHTLNPFMYLSAEELCQIMAAMAPSNRSDGMWRERALGLMNVIIKSLVWKRDKKQAAITISNIEELMNLSELEEFYMDMKADHDRDELIIKELRLYFETLPGFKFGVGNQSNTTREQHGYLSMQWTRVLSMLSGSYGHILNVEHSDIDIRDLVLNRRTLFVMLPSLEKSSSEIMNIGNIVVALIKSMMAQVLRTPVEGSWSKVVKDRKTHDEYPYLIIFDEVGQYMTDGMDTMAQQARSLNFGVIFSAQDFESLSASSAKMTDAILANTNTKILMKAEYPNSHIMEKIHGFKNNEYMKLLSYYAPKHAASRTISVDAIQYGGLYFPKGESPRDHLHSQNARQLDFVNGLPLEIIGLRLKEFKPGEFLVIHGTDYLFGKSAYVQIIEDDKEHEISLTRFASITGYQNNDIGETTNQLIDSLYLKTRDWLLTCDRDQINDDWLFDHGKNKTHLELANILYIEKKQNKFKQIHHDISFEHILHVNGVSTFAEQCMRAATKAIPNYEDRFAVMHNKVSVNKIEATQRDDEDIVLNVGPWNFLKNITIED